MTAVRTIDKIIQSGILNRDLSEIPKNGADFTQLAELDNGLPRAISKMHKQILVAWDGLNLEIIRIYGAGLSVASVKRLIESQRYAVTEDMIVFADDPAGFIFMEGGDGSVYSLDSKTSNFERIAFNLEEFFADKVFGKDAEEFMGDYWFGRLKDFNLV
ncbi:hypothetical protein [Acidovorax sp.]|uniref:hypothetical protein n=1 Tax=Acidovorax sp. TaxID=1872122 RepID=UPI003D00ED19